jgi:ureidoacrylate peracid hydrolase
MKAEETALLLIQFQNEFCSPDGALYEVFKGELTRRKTIENAIELVKKARQKNVKIIHVPLVYSDDYHELGEQPVGARRNIFAKRAFRKGTRGAEIIEELKPLPEDIVIEGKKTLCAFDSTGLDLTLRSHGIKNLAICGLPTRVCVLFTASGAYDKGYSVTLVKDCSCSALYEDQKFIEERIFSAIGNVWSHSEFLAEVE